MSSRAAGSRKFSGHPLGQEIMKFFSSPRGSALVKTYGRPGAYIYILTFDPHVLHPHISSTNHGDLEVTMTHTIETGCPSEPTFTMFQVWPVDGTVYVAFSHHRSEDGMIQKFMQLFLRQWNSRKAVGSRNTDDRQCSLFCIGECARQSCSTD